MLVLGRFTGTVCDCKGVTVPLASASTVPGVTLAAIGQNNEAEPRDWLTELRARGNYDHKPAISSFDLLLRTAVGVLCNSV